MHERERKYTEEKQTIPGEESHPVIDPLGENRRNPAKKHEKSMLNLSKHNYNKHNMLVLYERWKLWDFKCNLVVATTLQLLP